MSDQKIIIKYLEDKLSETNAELESCKSDSDEDEMCHDCGEFPHTTATTLNNTIYFLEKEIEWLKLRDKWIIENKEKPCPTKKQ